MKIQLTTNLFYGFYNSIFSDDDYLYETEKEELVELEKELDTKLPSFEISYEHENETLQEYKTDISKAFIDEFREKLEEAIPEEIQEEDSYIFNIQFLAVLSPKYYNYSTDTILYELETNQETLKLIKDYTLSIPNAEDYILKKYTSRDGYTSFLENSIDYWKGNEIESQENYLGALLDMLLTLTTEEAKFKLNLATYEETDPEITYMTRYLENKNTHKRIKYTDNLTEIKKWIKEE